jgi:4-oxalocrotonate tautomerase
MTRDLKITDATNMKDEKALFIVEVFQGFGSMRGDLLAESDIHLDDAGSAACGFGGRTRTFCCERKASV